MIRKFPKIKQFKDVLRCVHKSQTPNEIIEYEGTIKLHGTNASIVYNGDGLEAIQSRKNIITVQDDNAGFAKFVNDNLFLLTNPFYDLQHEGKLIIYGEFAGKGIQKGVGINNIDKAFFIFDAVIKYDDKETINVLKEVLGLIGSKSNLEIEDFNDESIYFMNQFEKYHCNINFGDVSKVNEFAAKASELTKIVGDHCPISKHLGFDGIGEGIVWKPINKFNEDLIFKTKDPRHSVTNIKTIVPLTDEQLDELNKVQEFVNMTVTDNRLEQACQEIDLDNEENNIGHVIRWVLNDIKEEEQGLIEKNNINMKLIGKKVSDKVRQYILGGLR